MAEVTINLLGKNGTQLGSFITKVPLTHPLIVDKVDRDFTNACKRFTNMYEKLREENTAMLNEQIRLLKEKVELQNQIIQKFSVHRYKFKPTLDIINGTTYDVPHPVLDKMRYLEHSSELAKQGLSIWDWLKGLNIPDLKPGSVGSITRIDDSDDDYFKWLITTERLAGKLPKK